MEEYGAAKARASVKETEVFMNTRSKEWRNSMRLTVNYNYMMKKFIGEDGLRDADLTAMKEEAADAFACVKENRGKGMPGWTPLPYDQ